MGELTAGDLPVQTRKIPDLPLATDVGDSDLFVLRQGTTDKKVAGSVIKQENADYAAKGNFCVESGVADAYIFEPSTGYSRVSSLQEGMRFYGETENTNTGAATINVHGKGVKNIVDLEGNSLSGSEIEGVFEVQYDLSSDNFKLLAEVPIKTESLNKNLIINGNFDIWQRGETFNNINNEFVADRWLLSNPQVVNASKQDFTVGQTDVPNNPTSYLRVDVNSVAGASNYVHLRQKIASVRATASKTVTLSFYAKADSAKNISLEMLQNFGTGGTPSSTVNFLGITTFSLTTSWQKFTATVTLPSISGKSLGSNENDYLDVRFWLEAGTDFDSRTNNLGQQSGVFDFSQVQLEFGSKATVFEYRDYNIEFDLCKKYGFLIHDGSFQLLIGTRVANTTSSGTATSAQVITSLNIPEMRVNPTIIGTPSNLKLHAETGGLRGSCTSHAWFNKSQNMIQLAYNSLDISDVTQLRTSSYLFLDAEL